MLSTTCFFNVLILDESDREDFFYRISGGMTYSSERIFVKDFIDGLLSPDNGSL